MTIIRLGNKNRELSAHELVELISEKVPPEVQINELRNTYPNGVVRGACAFLKLKNCSEII